MPDDSTDNELFWHPAFLPGLQLELEAWLDELSFETEHHLTTKPLQIDLLVIKKKKDAVIGNPIARMFRQFNVFEYKSPSVSLTVDEFYRAVVYVLLYKAIDGLDITDMTLSIVLTRHPGAVFGHIRDVWKGRVTEEESGIYRIDGFLFPIQIIENKRLSPGNNKFLRGLNEGLDEETIIWAIQLEKECHTIDISAYVDIIVRANEKRLKEMKMNSPALERIFEETGLAARLEARGRAEGEVRGRAEGEARGRAEADARARSEFARKLIMEGFDRQRIAKLAGLDLSAVDALFAEAGDN